MRKFRKCDFFLVMFLYSRQKTFIQTTKTQIGKKYFKAVWREFTDSSFTQMKPHSTNNLGIVGPTLYSIEGENIKVIVKNMLKKFSISFHVRGGWEYDKTSEGAPYFDNTYNQQFVGDIIEPGRSYTYFYRVRKILDDNISSRGFLYHSYTSGVSDIYTGLVGNIVITKSGFEISKTNPKPRDVESEMGLFFFGVVETLNGNEFRLVKTSPARKF